MKSMRAGRHGVSGGLLAGLGIAGLLFGGCGGVADLPDEGAAGATPSEAEALKATGPKRRPPASVPALKWSPCSKEIPNALCAVAGVPLDYDDPRGPSTGIALAKIPALDSAHKIGTLFVNPGGPGASGVDLVLTGFGDAMAAMLQGRFDIVGFDPRGVAASEPLQCFENKQDSDAFLAGMPAFPYLQMQKWPYYQHRSAAADRCLGRNPRIAAHMSTADVVRDLELLRQAVGDAGLSYLGFSYGTYIGNTYANLFPDKVRALAIDGVLDPQLWSSGRQIVADRVAPAHELAEFLRLCDEAPDDCALAGPGGAAARYDALARALRAQPLTLPDGSSYGYDNLIADSMEAMFAPESWGGSQGAAAGLALLSEVASGDTSALPKALASLKNFRESLGRSSSPRAGYDNELEAFWGNQCADTEFPSAFTDFLRIGTYAESGSALGPLLWWPNAACARWPVSADRYVGPWTARTKAPVLVVGNLFDGITDYNGAVASSRLLSNSRLLTYAGWGHTAFARNGCVRAHVVAYLLDTTLPPEGTVCPANPNPFLPQQGSALRAGAVGYVPPVGLPPAWLGIR